MSDRSVILLCYSLSDFNFFLKRKQLQKYKNIIVVSDNFEVQHAAQKLAIIDNVIFFEGYTTIFQIAPETKRIVKAINSFLCSTLFKIESNKELLDWTLHPEGGKTSKAVQDLLLLMTSSSKILRDTKATEVFVRKKFFESEEEFVFSKFASQKGLNIKNFYTLGGLVNTTALMIPLGGRRFGLTMPPAIPLLIAVFVKQTKLFLGLFSIKYLLYPKKKNKNLVAQTPQIVFQLGSNAKKHSEDILGPLLNLKKNHPQYHAIALCWRARKSSKYLKKAGVYSQNLEAWVKTRYLLKSLIKSHKAISTLKSYKRTFLTHNDLTFKNIHLASYLWPYILLYIKTDFVERLILHSTLNNYLHNNNVKAAKVWGDSMLDYGKTFHQLILKNRILTFHYEVGTDYDWPYFNIKSNTYFAYNKFAKERLLRQGVAQQNIELVRQLRYDHLTQFTSAYSQLKSQEQLGVNSNSSIIFFAASNIIRGIITEREQNALFQFLLEFAKDNPRIHILVKTHPSDFSGTIERLTESCNLTNVKLISKTQLPYHCINAADVVITKISAVGIEAMLMNRPLISIRLDGESKWDNIFCGYATIFEDLEQVRHFLTKTFIKERELSNWKQEKIFRQQDFVQEHSTIKCKKEIDETIIKRIELWQD